MYDSNIKILTKLPSEAEEFRDYRLYIFERQVYSVMILIGALFFALGFI